MGNEYEEIHNGQTRHRPIGVGEGHPEHKALRKYRAIKVACNEFFRKRGLRDKTIRDYHELRKEGEIAREREEERLIREDLAREPEFLRLERDDRDEDEEKEEG